MQSENIPIRSVPQNSSFNILLNFSFYAPPKKENHTILELHKIDSNWTIPLKVFHLSPNVRRTLLCDVKTPTRSTPRMKWNMHSYLPINTTVHTAGQHSHLKTSFHKRADASLGLRRKTTFRFRVYTQILYKLSTGRSLAQTSRRLLAPQTKRSPQRSW